MNIPLHAVLHMKKPHPCGGLTLEALRVGMDIRVRCLTCGREVLVPRHKLEKHIKSVEIPEAADV